MVDVLPIQSIEKQKPLPFGRGPSFFSIDWLKF